MDKVPLLFEDSEQDPREETCKTLDMDKPTAVLVLPAQKHRQVQKKPWSWCVVITSVFGFFCCSCFGITSFVQAISAYVDHKVGDYPRMERKKRCAFGLGIAAIVVGCIFWVGYIIMIRVFMQKATLALGQFSAIANIAGAQ